MYQRKVCISKYLILTMILIFDFEIASIVWYLFFILFLAGLKLYCLLYCWKLIQVVNDIRFIIIHTSLAVGWTISTSELNICWYRLFSGTYLLHTFSTGKFIRLLNIINEIKLARSFNFTSRYVDDVQFTTSAKYGSICMYYHFDCY
jgi:hypothetical protein